MRTIPLAECVDRGVYKLQSRNLDIGVFSIEKNSFTGLRLKWDELFLDSEYHYDNGAPYGTATPLELIGMLPPEIELRERTDTQDRETLRPVAFSEKFKQDPDVNWGWYWADTGKPDPEREIKPFSRMYQPLFDYLKKLEG